jgi:copper chaperone CopZ
VRKALTIGFTLVAFLALTLGTTYACDPAKCTSKTAQSPGCDHKATTNSASAKETPSTAAKAGCPFSKGVTTAAQLTTEENAKLCNHEGKCEYKTISIKGMTGVGCERTVTTAFSEVPGVIRVCHVSYKEGVAGVCIDPTKVTDEALTIAVVNKGYQAAIIPAVVSTSDTEDPSKLSGAKPSCSAVDETKAKGEGEKPK